MFLDQPVVCIISTLLEILCKLIDVLKGISVFEFDMKNIKMMYTSLFFNVKVKPFENFIILIM